MRIVTKHFGFAIFQWWWERPRWDQWAVRIGFVDAGQPLGMAPPYKLWAGLDIQLLPNFIWWQDYLGTEFDGFGERVIVHNRIVGIQNWPFMRFCGGRC